MFNASFADAVMVDSEHIGNVAVCEKIINRAAAAVRKNHFMHNMTVDVKIEKNSLLFHYNMLK